MSKHILSQSSPVKICGHVGNIRMAKTRIPRYSLNIHEFMNTAWFNADCCREYFWKRKLISKLIIIIKKSSPFSSNEINEDPERYNFAHASKLQVHPRAPLMNSSWRVQEHVQHRPRSRFQDYPALSRKKFQCAPCGPC